jgi:hypothetical protein
MVQLFPSALPDFNWFKPNTIYFVPSQKVYWYGKPMYVTALILPAGDGIIQYELVPTILLTPTCEIRYASAWELEPATEGQIFEQAIASSATACRVDGPELMRMAATLLFEEALCLAFECKSSRAKALNLLHQALHYSSDFPEVEQARRLICTLTSEQNGSYYRN